MNQLRLDNFSNTAVCLTNEVLFFKFENFIDKKRNQILKFHCTVIEFIFFPGEKSIFS